MCVCLLTISWAKKDATKEAGSVAAAPGPALKPFLGIASGSSQRKTREPGQWVHQGCAVLETGEGAGAALYLLQRPSLAWLAEPRINNGKQP